VVQDGRPRGEVRELRFDKGERVRFRVRSDVAEELHIHGYDRYVDVAPGRTATVSFPASIEGIFEVELHGAGVPLASLRVEP
jgi:heme/copper-type cytochrome/quinol oxidase subunit 2